MRSEVRAYSRQGHGRAPINRPDTYQRLPTAPSSHRCFNAVVSGRIGSVAELASREGISDRYVSSLLPLAFLAPEITEAIMAGLSRPT
jgi:site-specific DNA recombinase